MLHPIFYMKNLKSFEPRSIFGHMPFSMLPISEMASDQRSHYLIRQILSERLTVYLGKIQETSCAIPLKKHPHGTYLKDPIISIPYSRHRKLP